ncbi:MAG: hypothetical protein N4A74_09680 [Carboxylicivirga sp.]|jgi:hypothetical protein|nr:hypothetical protein [Carboxylicivirga sp.]
MEQYYRKYLDNRKALIRVICRTKQWSGLDECDIYNWLDNFEDTFGKYLALKILIHSIYYSEKNVVELLGHGIYEKIHSAEIKRQLVQDNNILIPRTETNSLLQDRLESSAFVPLLDKSRPGESGNQMTRYLIQKLNIAPSQTFFLEKLTDKVILKHKSIIFLDDCIGSGNQLDDFFGKPEVQTLVNLAVENNIGIYYLIITGYKYNIQKVQRKDNLKNIKIIACDELNDFDRIFNEQNILWQDKEEFDKANQYFIDLENNFGIKQYGWSDLDFAVFMHNTVPDWSLPIFYVDNSDWTPLMTRKGSNLY